jgi:mannose-6-phosphate isomerase-like protein (cupin superfamily)
MQKVNLAQKLSLFADRWAPRSIAQLNDYEVKLVKVQGDFVWHSHQETDELFLVLRGSLRIELRDGAVELGPGELFVVPRGVEHKPFAAEECEMMLIEPRGVVNTGDAGGALTAKPQSI